MEEYIYIKSNKSKYILMSLFVHCNIYTKDVNIHIMNTFFNNIQSLSESYVLNIYLNLKLLISYK